MKGKNILWLVSWYPNKEDPFDGDFIQRHARAAAVYNNIHVLFIKPIAGHLPARENISKNGNLTEQIVYIRKEHGVLKKFSQHIRWFRQYKKAVAAYVKVNGLPHLVHVHVPWKAGLIAIWMKKNYHVPYIITEHWGIYNEIVEDRFSARPFWMQLLFKVIYKQAAAFVSVSNFLAGAVRNYMGFQKSFIIRNVVDTTHFSYQKITVEPFTFLHVSNMVPLKNVAGILEAFVLFKSENKKARLRLIGNKNDHFSTYAHQLGIAEETITFGGEIPYADVAKEMQAAHCLIINSNIENAPCVIGEALCCGMPVIATNVGGIPELVNESNSILIPPNDKEALLHAMIKMYENHTKFDGFAIAAAAAIKFSYETIARQFYSLYNSLAHER